MAVPFLRKASLLSVLLCGVLAAQDVKKPQDKEQESPCPSKYFQIFGEAKLSEISTCIEAFDAELTRFANARKQEKDSVAARAKFFGIQKDDPNHLLATVEYPSVTRLQVRDLDFNESRDINLYLIRAHALYKGLKIQTNRAKVANPADTDIADVQFRLNLLGTFLHRLMRTQGLEEPFGALLDTGATFSATGNDEVPNARDSTDTEIRGTIRWESKHFRDDYGRKWDWSFGGQIGFAPALTLVQVKRVDNGNATSGTGNVVSPTPQALFRQAFVWDFGPRMNFPLRDGFEASVFTRVGQTRLWNATESFKRGSDSYVAEAVANRTGSAEAFYETGAELRLYDVPIDVAHHEKSYVNPAFLLSGGFRLDNRFQRSGTVLGSYDRPRDRWFYRMTVNLNKVLQPRKQGQESETFAFRFSVDHDHSLFESRIPQGTRYTFSTGIDVVKLFSGQSTGASTATNTTK